MWKIGLEAGFTARMDKCNDQRLLRTFRMSERVRHNSRKNNIGPAIYKSNASALATELDSRDSRAVLSSTANFGVDRASSSDSMI